MYTTVFLCYHNFFSSVTVGQFIAFIFWILVCAEIRAIRCALNILESLEAEIIPAVYNCYLDPTDQAAECHLQFLWRSFRDHYESLKSSLDSIADPVAFCHVKIETPSVLKS